MKGGISLEQLKQEFTTGKTIELEEQIKKLTEANLYLKELVGIRNKDVESLQNRCHVFTRAMMCDYCGFKDCKKKGKPLFQLKGDNE